MLLFFNHLHETTFSSSGCFLKKTSLENTFYEKKTDFTTHIRTSLENTVFMEKTNFTTNITIPLKETVHTSSLTTTSTISSLFSICANSGGCLQNAKCCNYNNISYCITNPYLTSNNQCPGVFPS